MKLLPSKNGEHRNISAPQGAPFSLHAALRSRIPHNFLTSPLRIEKDDAHHPEIWQAAEQYYYMLDESNPGRLQLHGSRHPRRVVLNSSTGPIEEDALYLLDKFVSPARQQSHHLSLSSSLAHSSSVRMSWQNGNTRMVELPNRCPLVLMKIFSAVAYDDGGNMLCRYEMRAIKRLKRWDNGSLVWPLQVSGKFTLVELQKV